MAPIGASRGKSLSPRTARNCSPVRRQGTATEAIVLPRSQNSRSRSMPRYLGTILVLVATATLASCQRAASSKATVDRNGVSRTADGKPDLTGVWQPDSDRPGTWAEANQGNGVADPGTGSRTRKAEPILYQFWAAAKVLEAYNRRYIDNPVARCIP